MRKHSDSSAAWTRGRLVAVAAVAWTLVIAASMWWNWHQSEHAARHYAEAEARAAYNKDLVYRRWASLNGGVYVPPSATTPPNPYLSHVPDRDITTSTGKALTLVNPAYMTRQVHELARQQYGTRGHITSLNPLRPENAPDPWEAGVLATFEKGATEGVAMAEIDGETYVRLMRPMIAEASCLKCHAIQGYRLGQVRGGLSVSVPFAPYEAAAHDQQWWIAGAHTFIWLLGFVGLFLWQGQMRRSDRAARARDEDMRTRLAQSQRLESIGRLAGGVAHDFNNMVGVIRGYTELALRGIPKSHPIHADLQEVLKAAGRSADLTRQLLAFARRQVAAPQVLDLNDTIEGMLKMLRRLIGEHVELSWRPGTGLGHVRIDPAQVDQVLANLCVNARDAIDGVGSIVIETANATIDEDFCEAHPGAVAGAYVSVAVRDTGRGMAPDVLANIFEPFFTTKPIGEGTGLGLSTVYGIVKQNNGYIDVESQPAAGTTFTIYLPRCEAPRAAEQPAAPVAIPRGQETILLVEDEPAMLSMTAGTLRHLGYQVLTASSPAAARELAGRHTGAIDLLLTDVIMPGDNGRALADDLSRERPGLRVLFMSGYTADVLAPHGILDATVHFLQKPFTMHDLGAALRKVIESGPAPAPPPAAH